MEQILTMSDTINVGKRKNVQVSDIVYKNGEILKLIKNGFQFDDEVLKEAHIKKIIRDVKYTNVITEHENVSKKTYTKDSESLKNILKSINTLENPNTENFDTPETITQEEISDIYTEDEE